MPYSDPVTMEERVALQKDCEIPYLPTELTYHFRRAVNGEGADEFLSPGYIWSDKPHRLMYRACTEIEKLTAQKERMQEATDTFYLKAKDAVERGFTTGVATVTITTTALNALIEAVEAQYVEDEA